ncbi:MAG: hypothetical protein R3335_15515, partial [Anaerolineales bacterium]|nr:hypothetical protein [Anaerolineales bacterium]
MLKKSSLIFPLLALVLSACIPDGIQVPESSLLRYLERKSGLIAFMGADGNIYTIDQAGNNIHAITDDAIFPGGPEELRYYQFISWSPDSDQLGYVSISTEGGQNYDVSVIAAEREGEGRSRLYTSSELRPFYLYWSPDGNKISFLSGGGPQGGLSLHVVPSEGGEARQLDEGSRLYYVWSPLSQELLANVFSEAGSELKFLQLGRDEPDASLSLEASPFQAPAWSPDLQKVYLAVTDPDGGSSLVEASQSGVPIRSLARIVGPIIFSLNSAGDRIAFVTSDTPGINAVVGHLRVIDLDTPEEILETEEDQVIAFFWSPDGSKLAYFTPNLIDPGADGVPGGNPVRALDLRILDLETEVSTFITSFRPTDEFLSILPHFDQYGRSATIWSPHTRYLVSPALVDNDRPVIFVVPAAAARPARLI